MRTEQTDFEAELLVAEHNSAADGVVALTLRHPEGAELPGWTPGAHIDLILPDGLTRQYSLCGDPGKRDEYRLAILREPAGRGGSHYLAEQLAAGHTITVRGPRSHFPLLESKHYLFIAGGIGITPILPMIAQAQSQGSDWKLLYGGRSRSSMAFLDQLAEYGDRVVIAPQDESGLLDLAGWLGTPVPDTLVYTCGPEPLLAAVEAQCVGWPTGSLQLERFSPKEITEPVLADSFEIILEQSGMTLTVPPDKSILQVVSEAGVPTLSACGEGTCGTCETTVLEGIPDHRDSLLDDDEKESCEFMMICISRSCTPQLRLDL